MFFGLRFIGEGAGWAVGRVTSVVLGFGSLVGLQGGQLAENHLPWGFGSLVRVQGGQFRVTSVVLGFGSLVGCRVGSWQSNQCCFGFGSAAWAVGRVTSVVLGGSLVRVQGGQLAE